MNTIQSWSGLPDSIKRQAAPDMLAGKSWYYFGNRVESPGAGELRKWAAVAPQSPQEGATAAGSIRTAATGISADIAHTRTREDKAMTRQQKRNAVDLALSANASISDRELSRTLGVSHTFVAIRRKAGNVASASKELK